MGAALREFGHGPTCEGHPLPNPLCCVVCRCCCCCGVVWCGVSVRCVFKIFVGASKIWALPLTPRLSLRRTPLRRTAQNFARFFPSPAPIFALFFSLSGGLLVEFWWCLKRRCQLCTFGLTGCRVKPRWLLQNAKNNFTIDLLPIRLPKKSMTNYCKICLYPRKKASNTTEIPRDDTALLPSGPTSWPSLFWVVVCAVCAAPDSVACCCFSCCLCSCCGLLLPLFLLLLVLVAAFEPPTVEPHSPLHLCSV